MKLKHASSNALLDFLSHYKDALSDSARNEVTRMTLAAMMREKYPHHRFPTVSQSLDLLTSFAKITSDPEELPFSAVVALIGDVSKEEVDIDLPVTVRHTKPNGIATLARSHKFVYVIYVIHSAPLRKVVKFETGSSRYVSSKSEVPNPRYAQALQQYHDIQAQYQKLVSENDQNQNLAQQNASSGNLGGLETLLNAGMAVASQSIMNKDEKLVEQSRQIVENTPQTILQDNYSAYSYRIETVRVIKPDKILIYALAPSANRFLSKTINTTQSSEFHLVAELNPSDPDRNTILANADSEDKINQFEQQSSSQTLSSLLAQLSQAHEQTLLPGSGNVIAGMKADVRRFVHNTAVQRAAYTATSQRLSEHLSPLANSQTATAASLKMSTSAGNLRPMVTTNTQASAKMIGNICNPKKQSLYSGSEQNVTLQAAACLYYCYYTATGRQDFYSGYMKSQNSANTLCSGGISTCNNIDLNICNYRSRGLAHSSLANSQGQLSRINSQYQMQPQPEPSPPIDNQTEQQCFDNQGRPQSCGLCPDGSHGPVCSAK